MPICIECSYPVSHLYSTYSRADDRSLGKGVRLTQCPRCKRFADKYVEHDFVVIFIDLVLIKPQVYRHLLFNRLGRDDNKFDRSIIRLGILLLLFDVYLTWARIEKSPSLASTFLSRAPIVVQYLFFLSLNALTTLAHHLTVRLLASVLAPKPRQWYDGPAPPAATTATTTTTNGSTVETPLASDPSTPVLPLFPACSSSVSLPTQQLWRTPSFSTSPTRPISTISNENIENGNTAAAAAATLSPGAQLPPPTTPLGSHSPTFGPRRPSAALIQPVRPLPPPFPASPTAISTALLVSSSAKLFPILLVIWGPDGSGNSMQVTKSSTAVPDLAAPMSTAPVTTAVTTMANMLLSSATSKHTAAAAASAIPGSHSSLSSSSSSPSSSSFSVFEWPAKLALSMHDSPSTPIKYLASLVQLLVPALSLSAADTHLVFLNNIEAMYILLGCGYLRAVALAVAGQVARWAVQRVILGAVGVS
ncbi:hypothetical protein ASPZODRAFT_16525 [Penicilliopsis zonata CBS 506.65]|uniref:Protein ARV n=1 Tax=Penicilliopsis zonata CBS 506.65 TaxID=1073090 RepID=A0A1L9SIB7_9EURO|nr:hypothetical protein ASPZODRAFT_16525 [Penicilliopsis zonata CBS 506.65]OJJ46774.1 hypothetical protein ASPZODRAFT_16525 [Penicilliopsis zonata CBS 506.65]